jgi:4-hydroxy-tetrahydrodipicolinate reductase
MDIIVNGILGHMGRMVVETAAEDADLRVVAGFDKAAGGAGADAPLFRGAPVPVLEPYDDSAPGADAVIDFSHFSAVPGLLAWAQGRGLPVVVCTTALGEAERAAMAEAARSIPVFNSANMSLGINLVMKLAAQAAPVLERDFNTEIIEAHHNRKKDSPSGTALMLADAISEACDAPKDYVYGRHGTDDAVKITDLGIHAVRGGTLPGRHTIVFAGPDEVIEITHTAYSRRIFALGALKAAAYVRSAPPGSYSMADIL